MSAALFAFGRFWWDLFVGDTPEITAGALVVLGIAYLVRAASALAVVVIPLAVICLLALSLRRGLPQR